MDIQAFRDAFPEFTAELYPDSAVTFWSTLAELSVGVDRWGDYYTQGLYLLTAHYLQVSKFSASGAASGLNMAITSKKVGDVQVSYSNIIGNITGAGQYNSTPYGQQYWQLVQLIGIGAIQL
jgi:hypothetical protein